jgi:hypothetical protein
MNDERKKFVIRKYITADSLADALKKDSKTPVSEIFLDDRQDTRTTDAIGFRYVGTENEE